jgi:RHS repeat-associated protein
VWGTTPTSYRYTGQRSETSLSIYYYGARWYDSSLGRFLSPDTDVPESQGVQAWDKMAYANNNPVRFNDPSGHVCSDPEAPYQRCDGGPNRNYRGYTGSDTRSKPPFDASLGGNAKDSSEISEPPDPSIGGIVVTGVVLTVAVVITEVLLTWAEVAVIPVVHAMPIVGVPLEGMLIGSSLAVLDFEVAYWSYAARVYQNPDEKQEFELFPPYGLSGDR